MHREYRPGDMNLLQGHAHSHPDEAHEDDHAVHDDRALYGLTALIGVLLAGELLFGWLGWETWRAPWGVSLALVAAVLGGSRIVYGAIETLTHGRVGADLALAQACLAALVIGQPFVAAEVVFIALVGEVLEAVTYSRALRSIHRLLDQSPRTARVRRDGQETTVPAGEVRVGDIVVVRAGERIPVDGPVLVGRTSVDQSALTGESLPADKGPGEPVYTGTLNQFGAIDVRADKVGQETTLGQVLRLVSEARKRKAPLERVADRMARYFLPVVEVVAGLTLLSGWLLGSPDVWLRTVAVLVVACPCALVLATPAAMLASMAWLARHGVLIKGGAALERLAACDTIVFDKTGTLTYGRPEVACLLPMGGLTGEDLLRLAATAEVSSPHPLARAVAAEAERRGISPMTATEAVALPGSGVAVKFNETGGDATDRSLLVGNQRLMSEHQVSLDDEAVAALDALDGRGETPLIVALDGRVVGLIGTRDAVRPEAHDVIHDLKHLKFGQVAILTGDRSGPARAVAMRVHVKTIESELLPADKARWVGRAQAEGRKVVMVGDGINDAPALAAANVGIALGGIGAELAAEAGDLVLLGDPLRVLPDLVRLSRATVSVIRQNIIGFAFGLNFLAMGSAALGWLGPVAAAVLHQVGSLLVLLNAMRLLTFGSWSETGPARGLRSLGGAIRRLDDRLDPGLALVILAARWRGLAAVGAGLLAVVAATWGWTAIEPDELGLVRRFGRHVATLRPGLHFRWPPPIETVTRLAPDRVYSVEIGFRTVASDRDALSWESGHQRGFSARAGDESLLMTGDGRLVELAAAAQYHLDGQRPNALRAYAFGVSDPDRALRPLAESAVRAVVGRTDLDALLTRGRHDAERATAALLQSRVEAYVLGLRVIGVAFQDVHPPISVVDAYRDVSRAESERQRSRNDAKTYRAEALAGARGQADVTVNRAEGAKATLLERAGGQADAFRYLTAARAGYEWSTDQRLYWDAVGSILAGKPKLLLDPGRAYPRHLVLPDFPPGASAWPASIPGLLVGPPRPAQDSAR